MYKPLAHKLRVLRRAAFCCLPFVFLSTSLWAEAEPRQLGVNAASPMAGSPLLQVTLGLVVVIGIMLALAWLAKRLRLVPGGSHHQSMKVLAVLPLSNRERLILVQVGEQQLLLGVTANQINCLHELEKPLEINKGQTQPGFAQLLNQWKKSGVSGNFEKGHKNES